MSDQNMNLYKP